MKYLGIYIKDRKMYFLLTAFICGVTAVINYLYSAPLQAGLYAFEISLTVLVMYLPPIMCIFLKNMKIFKDTVT